jgi:hypothetical protein
MVTNDNGHRGQLTHHRAHDTTPRDKARWCQVQRKDLEFCSALSMRASPVSATLTVGAEFAQSGL